MKYGIIGAMDEEIELLKQSMKQSVEHHIANALFIEGSIGDKQVVLVKSGIGKVNAAMTTTILMERFQPDYIINTGSAGGFEKSLEVGDVVISKEVVHHDVDVTAFDYAYGQVPGLPAALESDTSLIKRTESALKQLDIGHQIGLIATGDVFMSDPVLVQKTREKFPLMLAAEMEAAAIAQVSYQYDVPFVVIRALSDIAGKESSTSFDAFLQQAAENAANLIITILKQA